MRPYHTPVDLTGRVFGRWTVVGARPHRRGHKSTWRCRCACGATGEKRGDKLLSGESMSCGCWMRERVGKPRPGNRLDLEGQQIGDLVPLGLGPAVPSPSRYLKNGYTAWICRCTCGRVVLVKTSDLTKVLDGRAKTLSCGHRHLRPAVAWPPVPASDTRPAPVGKNPTRPVSPPAVSERVHDEAVAGAMKVRATRRAYYEKALRRPGDVFELRDPGHFSTAWMERVDDDRRERRQSAQDVLDRTFEEKHGLRPRDVQVSQPADDDENTVLHDGDPFL